MNDAVRRLRAWSERVRASAQAQLAAAERFYLAMLDRVGIDVGPGQATEEPPREDHGEHEEHGEREDRGEAAGRRTRRRRKRRRRAHD